MSKEQTSSAESVPVCHYKVRDVLLNAQPSRELTTHDDISDPRTYSTGTEKHSQLLEEDYVLPELPDFTKRPKIMSSSSNSSYSRYDSRPSLDKNNSTGTHYCYAPQPERPEIGLRSKSCGSRGTSVAFFSDQTADEKTYNELPLNEILDDFDYNDDVQSINEEDEGFTSQDADNTVDHIEHQNITPSRENTPTSRYDSIGRDITRGESPFMAIKPVEYTNEIPPFYDSSKLNYPYKSPLDYTDEEFENMNHFDFLKDLNFQPPPLLPVYLNSNLLNDSSSKNYRTFPYQYQESTVPHVNEIYRYRISELNTMDKYSSNINGSGTAKSHLNRPPLKRSSSSNSSNSSVMASKSANGRSYKSASRTKLLGDNSSGSAKSGASAKLKHADKISLIERNLIPHHVMLNHLITCNLNKDGYITSSCITRYKGKFITQIMFLSNELEKL